MLLYIHIPFCDSKCNYCAFNSYTALHYLRDKYVNALCKQLEFELKDIKNNEIKTIFIGGGTPSTLNIKHYNQIFNILNSYLKNIQEVTIEANPNSATQQWLKDIRSLKINRISFGVQSFNDKKLKFLGRNHTFKMAVEAIKIAKNVGFEHINCDIIYDTILDTKELINNDLNIIKSLPIDHISAYSLTLEAGTQFYNKNNIKVDDENMAKYIFKQLKIQGFRQYEISNFALSDSAKSKHNLGYWQYKSYIGVGAGAIGCIKNKRYYNHKDIQKYIQNYSTFEEIEKLTKEDIKTEKILLGFRCEIGVDKSILNEKEILKANNLQEIDKIRFKNNKYYATDFLLADELALYILE